MLLARRVTNLVKRSSVTRYARLKFYRDSAAHARSMSTAAVSDRAQAILTYWFGADHLDPEYWPSGEIVHRWFQGGPEVDKEVKQQFTSDVEALRSGKCEDWLQQPASALAGIILADQFTRNVYRGTADAFQLDHKALSWAKHMQDNGLDEQLPSCALRVFVIYPFMHSEALDDQNRCVDSAKAIYDAAAAQDPDSQAAKFLLSTMKYAEDHRDVVTKFGRFPHRNAMLGRKSTPEEQAGLADGSIGQW